MGSCPLFAAPCRLSPYTQGPGPTFHHQEARKRTIAGRPPRDPRPAGRKPERDFSLPPTFACQKSRFRLPVQGSVLFQRQPAWLVLFRRSAGHDSRACPDHPEGCIMPATALLCCRPMLCCTAGGGWRFPPSGGHCCPAEDLWEAGIPAPWAPYAPASRPERLGFGTGVQSAVNKGRDPLFQAAAPAFAIPFTDFRTFLPAGRGRTPVWLAGAASCGRSRRARGGVVTSNLHCLSCI